VARWIKRFMSRGLYDKATSIGDALRKSPNQFIRPNLSNSRLAQADAEVYYAQALIYTGKEVDEGIALLKKHILDLEGQQKPDDLARQGNPHEYISWKRNLVLGRGHNNLGYAYWIEKSHYQLALREFRLAVPYFRASDMDEENATTCDNMGRVCTLLYESGRAEALLDDSLALREKLGRSYRIGLSLNSRAICCLTFEQPHRARQLAKEALKIFEDLGALRGIGLASISLGRSLRQLGNLGAAGLYSSNETEELFKLSEKTLNEAISIFGGKIHEPVRLIEAYNELGCTYRDWAAKAAKENRSTAKYIQNAIANLENSMTLSEASHPVFYIDSCEDLAQIHYQKEDFERSEDWLQIAEDRVPSDYKLHEGKGISAIAEEELIEEYFLMLGKIELTRGYISFDRGIRIGGSQIPRDDLVQSIRHFAFAVTYFERFSDRAAGLEKAYKQLYERFKKCKHDDLRYLLEQAIPDIARQYGLDPKWLSRFFEDTLGLALLLEV
jgi:tetratricopeptide (TPR) repeat protein